MKTSEQKLADLSPEFLRSQAILSKFLVVIKMYGIDTNSVYAAVAWAVATGLIPSPEERKLFLHNFEAYAEIAGMDIDKQQVKAIFSFISNNETALSLELIEDMHKAHPEQSGEKAILTIQDGKFEIKPETIEQVRGKSNTPK